MKTIVLCGKSGSGKTTVGLELEKLGYSKIVTYTTRPMRKGEVNGIDYNFVTEEEFLALQDKSIFAETASYNASFGFCRYGSAKRDYAQPNSYIILNPIGLQTVRLNRVDIFAVNLRADEYTLTRRLRTRGDTPEEIARRLAADERDFKYINRYIDFTVSATDKPENIAWAINRLTIMAEKEEESDEEETSKGRERNFA